MGCLWRWQAFTLPPNPQDSRLSYHRAMQRSTDLPCIYWIRYGVIFFWKGPHFKHGSAILRRLKFFVSYHCHRQFSLSSNSECWKPCTAVQVFSRYQKRREYSANPSGPRTTFREGSISSRSCLEANTTTYPGTSKCSRLGMASILDCWIETWSTLPEQEPITKSL